MPPLGRERDAAVHDFVRRHAGDVLAVGEDVSRVRLHEADDHVKAGGFSRAVGAEQPDDLALRNLEADAANHLTSFVGLADLVGRQLLHHFTVRVSVTAFDRPPVTLTLSSRLSKIKASPETAPWA